MFSFLSLFNSFIKTKQKEKNVVCTKLKHFKMDLMLARHLRR